MQIYEIRQDLIFDLLLSRKDEDSDIWKRFFGPLEVKLIEFNE